MNNERLIPIAVLAFFIAMPFIFLLIGLLWNIWYKKHYTDGVAHKCWDCKKIEWQMYYTRTLFGRVHRCLECSNKHESKNEKK
jgi:hypothetical protein